jgi:hypothetical protein
LTWTIVEPLGWLALSPAPGPYTAMVLDNTCRPLVAACAGDTANSAAIVASAVAKTANMLRRENIESRALRWGNAERQATNN